MDLSWKNIYEEFGRRLLDYKNSRKELIAKIKNVYKDINIALPKLEEGELIDIDPFTIYALFNKHLKLENRIKIIKGIKIEFDLKSEIPTGFDSIPIMMNLSATFYWFNGGRGENDIDNIWSFYEASYNYVDDKNEETYEAFCNLFDLVKQQNGISWRLTTGLYWVFPDEFLSLDSINRWYIGEYFADFSEDIKNTFLKLNSLPSGKEYLEICDKVRKEFTKPNFKYHDFITLSHDAFIMADKVNKENKEKEKANEIETKDNSIHYWIYSPGANASLWDECKDNNEILLGWGEVGDASKFNDKNEIRNKLKEIFNRDSSYKNDAHAIWQFAKEMKVGDIIYAKKGIKTIIGRGIINSEYVYDDTKKEFNHVRYVEWTNIGTWNHPRHAVLKTLTDITTDPDYVEQLELLFDEKVEEILDKEIKYQPYNKVDFLKSAYMGSDEYDRLKGLLMYDKNIILQGAPGVGKTFIARKLAYSIMGEANTERVEMVQFHQSYSYEDFVIGYRPGENNTFELNEGVFYKFCQKALEDDENNPYFFIIDEINRGNLSKIFGELFMLIERDKRDIEIPLLYGKRKFKIPKNVYIIGTMNTADRSLAIIDYALRRRFAFYTINPQFDNEHFMEDISSYNNEKLISLIDTVKFLNQAILKDESLGEGFMVGHSYFCDLKDSDDITLSNIVEYKLIEFLKEYWFDEPSKINTWSEALRKSIK